MLHTAGYSQRGGQCRQHRHDDLNHRLPKFLVLHTSIQFFFFSLADLTDDADCLINKSLKKQAAPICEIRAICEK